MKKHISIFCTMLLAFVANGQSKNEGLKIGIHVQPNVSWIKTDYRALKSDGAKIGLAGGLFIENNLTKHALWHLGLSITQIGGKTSYDTLSASNNNTASFSNVVYSYSTRYVEVPATIKLITEDIGNMAYYGELGLAVGFLWRGRADLSQNIFAANDEFGFESRDVNGGRNDFAPTSNGIKEDGISFFRFGLIAGLGTEYRITEAASLLGGLRFNSGVSDVFRDSKAKGSNHYVSLMLGVKF